ncbi:chain length determinant protein EpsF [Thiorhodovibrio winogradskyi]|uniref:Chain length determinant protein EpsF n=1 Tax=Thiorhodovibrio winogradskyi TaxID=77007 RepID=A0ABZ0S5L6_9GAMM|nr:hypothetical protein [Thiorhodovibrio winogradskyi]
MDAQKFFAAHTASGQAPAETPVRVARWKIFLSVLLVSLVIGLVVVYARPPVYRATVSVLTVKPKAVDALSADADFEHVAIQERLLLGETLIARLREALLGHDAPALSREGLAGMLSVAQVPFTNLLELRAEGREPRQLQVVANTWAETYQAFRVEEISAASGRTTAELEAEQGTLVARIERTRAELARFAERFDIVSLEREENRTVAALKGLNDSLAKARERVVDARANLDAVDAAIARGTTVVTNEQQADLARLRRDYERARDRLDGLLGRFTLKYLERDPTLRDLPEQVRLLERELKRTIERARESVRDQAVQELDAATEAVSALQNEIDVQQREVQQFSKRFKEYESLEGELARLETLLADNRERLARIEMRNFEDYPPIQIVESASLPTSPVYPHYRRDLFIAIGLSLLGALFVTWLVDYLSGRNKPANVSYVGVRIDPGFELIGSPSSKSPQQGVDRQLPWQATKQLGSEDNL